VMNFLQMVTHVATVEERTAWKTGEKYAWTQDYETQTKQLQISEFEYLQLAPIAQTG